MNTQTHRTADTSEIYAMVSFNHKEREGERNSNVFAFAYSGMVDAASAIDPDIRIEWHGPNAWDPIPEIKAIQALTDRQVHGILVTAADKSALDESINAAIQAGIPVINFDADSPASERLTLVGTDNYKAGYLAGKTMAEWLGGQGDVAVSTIEHADHLIERLRGFKDALTQHAPQTNIYVAYDSGNIAVDESGQQDFTEYRQSYIRLLQAHPEIRGLFATYAIPGAGAAQAVEELGLLGKIHILAFDFDEVIIKLVETDKIRATVGQDAYMMGYASMILLHAARHAKQLPTKTAGAWRAHALADFVATHPKIHLNTAARLQDIISRLKGTKGSKPGLIDTGARILGKLELLDILAKDFEDMRDSISEKIEFLGRQIEIRKRAEETAIQNERLFRSLFEKSADAILLLENGIFTDCNQATVEMMHADDKQQFLSLHPSLLSPEFQPDGRPSGEKADEMIRTALERGSHRFEWVHRRVDGSDFPVEVLLTPITIDDRQVIYTVWRDITKRKQSEQDIRGSEQRFRTMADFTYGWETWLTPAGNYIYVSPSCERISGYPPQDYLERPELFIEITHPEDRALVESHVHTHGLTTETEPLEYRILTKDGQVRWINHACIPVQDAEGNFQGRRGSNTDITARKQAEEELRRNIQQQELLNTLLNLSLENRPLTEQLERALKVIVETTSFLDFKSRAGIFLVENENTLTLQANRGLAPQLLTICAMVPFGRCLCGRAAATGQLQFADCVDERHENRFDGMGPHGHYNVPIMSQNKLLGVMVLYLPEGHSKKKSEEDYLLTIAGTLATMIERRQLEQQIQQSLEKREAQVQTSTEVAQEIAAAPALDELFQRVVTLIKERFGYYHAQLFRHDPAQDAMVLVSGYGAAGQKMLAAGHQLPSGSGVVGAAAATGTAILAARVAEVQGWRPNPNLPETQGELAVPIKLRDQVLGVLDVQSDQAGALTQEDQLLLEGLCGQIAIALENTRVLQEAATFRQLVATANQGIGITSLHGDVVYINPELTRMLSLSTQEEMVGRSALELYPVSVREQITQEIIPAVLQTGQWAGELEMQVFGRETGIQTINNFFIIRDEQGAPRYVGNSITDITARKQAELALRRSETELSQALQIAKLAYWEYDVEKDLFHFNDQFYTLFHTTAAQEGGYQLSSAQYAGKFVYPDDLFMVGGEIERALNSTDQHYSRDLVHRILYADGGVGYISVSINIDRDENGKILRYYGANQDITAAKLAELELNKFKLGLERSTSAIFMTDQQGVITYVNPGFTKIYGYAPEEALGQTPRILKSGHTSREEYQVFWNTLLAGETVLSERINRTKDGRLISVEANNTPILDENGQVMGFLSMHMDVGDRKEAERKLTESEHLMRALIDTIPDYIYVKDLEGRHLLGNAALAKLYGMQSTDELLGKNDFDFYPHDLAEQYFASEKPILRDGKALISHEEPNVDAEGNQKWNSTTKVPLRDQSGKIIGLVGITSDITHRKEIELELARSAQMLRTIIDTSHDLIYIKDTESRFLVASQAVAELFGQQSPEALIGKRDFDFYPAELAQKYFDDEQQIIQRGQPLIDFEEPAVKPDGTPIWISTTKIPYRDSDGKLMGLVGIGHDITERKKEEQRLAETLREVERLYATVSHEEWQAYRETEQLPDGYLYDRLEIQPAPQMWEPEIGQAIEQNETVSTHSEQRAVVVTPLAVRGEIIGALGLYDNPDRPLTPEDVALVEATSEQVSLALESARLFDQIQRDAERERTINRITSQVRSAQSVDEVLEIAAQELSLLTHASRSVIEIAPQVTAATRASDSADRLAGNGHGHTGESVTLRKA